MNSTTPESADEIYAGDEDFAALFAESIEKADTTVGTVVTGTIISIENDMALVDVGLKAEGRVSIKEFAADGEDPEIKVGDQVEVFLDRLENAQGEAVLSREKARREEAWIQLERAFNGGERVEGIIFGRVKGGFTVDLSGAVAFLPGSQVDIRPVRDITPLMNIPHEFVILKMDRHRGNIVVSRRSVLEESRAEQRDELIANLKEGLILEGVVKNITDYGAFVDLGGVDGLLHVTDIAWRRVNHPTEVLSIAQTINVQVIRFNRGTQRISLGMKQLEADPWEGVEVKYPVDTKFIGRVTNITDYGAFVELEPGVEGLVHVSEMSWTKKNIHPGKIISTSQEVEVKVLDVDPVKRRISLGLKQCRDNPWENFVELHPVDSLVEGEVKNITEFGIFIGLPGDIDGMAHMSDISWDRPGDEAIKDFNKGDMVKAKVLDVDVAKERISLGIKQLSEDPFTGALASVKRGAQVTCAVTAITDGGIEVSVDGARGFIRKAELSRHRGHQRPESFVVGEKVDARVTSIDQATRRISLSIKGLEAQEEKQAMSEYGSSDSGASLGDILGAAIDKAEEKRASEAAEKTEKETEATEAAAPEAAEEDAPEAAEEATKPNAKAAATKKTTAKKTTAKKTTAKKAVTKKAATKKAAAPKKAATTKKAAATKKPAAAKKDAEDD